MAYPNLFRITPCLQARDVEAMVRFFTEVLGFEVWHQSWDFAYVQRDSAAVRIHRASEDCPEETHTVGPRAFLLYIDVHDVDAIVLEIKPKLLAAGLPLGSGPVNQTWGQREFWVSVPEGGLILFGQAIDPPGPR